jgi:hypothetical protein
LLATRAKATTEDDLDALMAQYGFEEGDDCSGEKGEKKKSAGGGLDEGEEEKTTEEIVLSSFESIYNVLLLYDGLLLKRPVTWR